MLNINTHKIALVRILKEVYTNPVLRTALGFKGGTAAVLFYNLPRFSVDLDFDLLDSDKKDLVFDNLTKILLEFGKLNDAIEKKNTLFFLLNYEKGLRNLKLEVSKRTSNASYEVKNYLGISILVMKKGDMVAGKLSALLTRRKFATRDLFDLWYFLKDNWTINEDLLKENTNLSLKNALEKTEEKILDIKKNQLLSGLGDLLDLKQRVWVKDKLKEDLLFQLRLYKSNIVV